MTDQLQPSETCRHNHRDIAHPPNGRCCEGVHTSTGIPIDYCGQRLPCPDHPVVPPARSAEERTETEDREIDAMHDLAWAMCHPQAGQSDGEQFTGAVRLILDERDQARATITELQQERDARTGVLRREWWLNHGCSIAALYGDDGEMQCGACLLDFKRAPMGTLAEHVQERRLARAVAAQPAPVQVDVERIAQIATHLREMDCGASNADHYQRLCLCNELEGLADRVQVIADELRRQLGKGE